MVRPILMAAVISIFPTIIQGQGRGMASGGAHAMAAAPRAVAHVAQPMASQTMPGARLVARPGMPITRPGVNRTTRRPIGASRRMVADGRGLRPGCRNVPGLGFDAVHLAAVCGPGAFGAGRNGIQSPFFFPFFEGGFYIPGSTDVADQGAAGDPQQTEDTEADSSDRPRRTRVYASSQTQGNEAAGAASSHSEEFVFVRRDGTVFFAVAYAWESGTLRYVTSEGLRRSVARDALDMDATQQFNEQRGMNFRLPA